MESDYQQLISRKRREYGNKFDASELDPRFARFLHTETRVKIDFSGIGEHGETVYGHTIVTGTIGVTTGWKPCFLLMRTRRSMGSELTLRPKDKIIAVQNSRGKYIPITVYPDGGTPQDHRALDWGSIPRLNYGIPNYRT